MDITVSFLFSLDFPQQTGMWSCCNPQQPHASPQLRLLFSSLTSLHLSSLRPVVSGVCCVHSPKWACLSQKDCLTFWSVLGNNCGWSPNSTLKPIYFLLITPPELKLFCLHLWVLPWSENNIFKVTFTKDFLFKLTVVLNTLTFKFAYILSS